MKLLILSDGKKGHENQSLGLAEALLRREPGNYETLSISNPGDLKTKGRKPDAVIGAGHSTHPFLLRIARLHRCPSMVIMKPSLPSFLFTHCLIPEHDLKQGRSIRKNIIPTKGALNRIPEEVPPKEERGLIMLGGPSKHFEWRSEPVLQAVKAIISSRPDLTWTLGDSRRTPADTLAQLLALDLPITVMPHQDSGEHWLIEQLLASREAWITPDSTSMISEALTAGCHLGTLPLPPLKTRLARALEQWVQGGWLQPFASHEPSLPLHAPPSRLHETARCAELLLEKIRS